MLVVPLSCACIVHACTRHTHTPAFALQTHSVWMACKVSLACERQRYFKDYQSRSSCNGVPATLCGPIVCIIRNRLAIRAAAPHICKEHAHVYHTHILSSRRPISMPRPHWLHHQQTAWRLSYGNSHLQGARPFGPQAHSELVTTRWYGSPMFVSSVIGSASLLMVVACSTSQQLIWYSQCICIAAAFCFDRKCIAFALCL